MPSKSKKQARTMAAAAHSVSFAKKAKIPRKVAREYNRADKGSDRMHDAMMSQARGRKKYGY